MEPSRNFLSNMKTSVFGHLFRFLHDVSLEEVCNAYIISHDHDECKCNKHCRDFHASSQLKVVWECAELRLVPEFPFSSTLRSALTDKQRDKLTQIYNTTLKHVSLLTESYLLQDNTFECLTQTLVDDNTLLQSVFFRMKINRDTALYYFHELRDKYSDEHTVSDLMLKLAQKQVKVTLEMIIERSPSVENCCKLYSIPEDDRLCQSLTSLTLSIGFPGESTISSARRELGATPTAVFVSKLPVLQQLQLDVCNLSPSLFHVLTRRAEKKKLPKLRTLTIFMDGTCPYVLKHGVPVLSEGDWAALVRACPELKVFCEIRNVSSDNLFRVVKANAPLVSLILLEVMEPQDDIIRGCRHFANTLRFVQCYTRWGFAVGNFHDLVAGEFFMTRRTLSIEDIDIIITVI